MKAQNHMAKDQWGNTFHALGANPRAELLRRLDRQHASKMYIDTKSGSTQHVGWIIAGHWLTVYEVYEAKRINTP